MKISYNWLKDYIDIKLTPQKLGEALTMAGLTTEAVHELGGDHILEIEITANRPDWLSYVGVARELSAITGAKLKAPIVSRLASSPVNRHTGTPAHRLTIKVEDKKLCPRYSARIIRDVKIGDSPEWLKKKLEAMAMRPVNNIVDITNFCLFETGEPMHAFDLDRIDGAEVIIRKARKGEKIVTIDGVERSLDDSMLVIADKTKPIAIAGVMGAINTEVTAATKNILLEAAYFDQISVRRTRRVLGISSESSYRFERKVDLNNIKYASDRAAGLITETAKGAMGGFTDIGGKSTPSKTITLKYAKLNSVLGMEVPVQQVKRIVSSLGMNIKNSSKDKITVETPSFRNDLNSEIDVIEEVARIYGYHKVPSTIPQIVAQDEKMPPGRMIAKNIRTVLAGLGASEIITYSLLGRNILSASGMADSAAPEIKNPLSAEQEVMRPTLMPGMLTAILWNINRKSKNLKLFEIGNVYIKEGGDKFKETNHLAIGMAGEISSWAEGARPCSFFDLKGAVEALLSVVGIDNAVFRQARLSGYSNSCAASIEISGEIIGTAGEIAKAILHNFDVKETAYYCEISLEAVLKYANLEKRFRELPKYPSVCRDISLVVSKDVLNAELVNLIKETAGAMLKEAALIDRYSGKQISDGKVSLTYRLEYQDPSRTLEEKDVSAVHSKILRALEEKFGAKLR